MIDERDMSQERQWFYAQRAATVVSNLQKKHISARYVPSRQEALSGIMDMIPPGAVVARGDSVSCEQVGILAALKKRHQNVIIDPLERDSKGSYIHETAERLRLHREAFLADVFLTSTNAITMDGKLVNVDGWGNRVAAMIFGPEKVIIVAGVNKIVEDTDEAIDRIHNYAAPLNARRHTVKHNSAELADLPCITSGVCMDCNHDYRICRYTVIIEGAMLPQKGRLNVVLIGEDLGI